MPSWSEFRAVDHLQLGKRQDPTTPGATGSPCGDSWDWQEGSAEEIGIARGRGVAGHNFALIHICLVVSRFQIFQVSRIRNSQICEPAIICLVEMPSRLQASLSQLRSWSVAGDNLFPRRRDPQGSTSLFDNKASHAQTEGVARYEMGKLYSIPIDEGAVLRLKIENHQPSIDLVDLTVETADPRVTEANIAVGVSANNCRQMLQGYCGSAVPSRM